MTWRQLLQTNGRVESIPLKWRVKMEQVVETFQASSDSLSDGMSSPPASEAPPIE
jgi:hypothetical protein